MKFKLIDIMPQSAGDKKLSISILKVNWIKF